MKVALPALHISLGTFLKFFNMLEFRCHLLDIKIAGELAIRNKSLNREEFDKFVKSKSEIRDLEFQAEDLHNKIELVHSAIYNRVTNEPEKEDEIRHIYEPRIKYLNNKLTEKVSQVYFLMTEIYKMNAPFCL